MRYGIGAVGGRCGRSTDVLAEHQCTNLNNEYTFRSLSELTRYAFCVPRDEVERLSGLDAHKEHSNSSIGNSRVHATLPFHVLAPLRLE